jgi:hypothetical protein
MYYKKGKKCLPKAQKGKFMGEGPYNQVEQDWELYQVAQEQAKKNAMTATGNPIGNNVPGALPPGMQSNMLQSKNTFGENINWNHVFGSNMITSLGQGLAHRGANSYQNATLRFNEQMYNPMNYLQHTPNNSLQSLYGMQEGGEVEDEEFMDFLFNDPEKVEVVQQASAKPQQQISITPQESDEDVYASIATNFTRRPKKNIAKEIDPNVIAAMQELKGKFPGLQMTSGLRSWGDKDGHPIGKAVDMAGKDLPEAYKYYAENIVPKYGFRKALPMNHGTGAHIHVGQYGEGGNINTTGYLDGADTANNPYNIIPGGDITMDGVSRRIVATPIKQGHYGESIVMEPGQDYKFDADYVHEVPAMQQGGNIQYGAYNMTSSKKELQAAYERTVAISSLPASQQADVKIQEEGKKLDAIFDKYKVPKKVDGSTTQYDFIWLQQQLSKPDPKPKKVDPKMKAYSDSLALYKSGLYNKKKTPQFTDPQVDFEEVPYAKKKVLNPNNINPKIKPIDVIYGEPYTTAGSGSNYKSDSYQDVRHIYKKPTMPITDVPMTSTPVERVSSIERPEVLPQFQVSPRAPLAPEKTAYSMQLRNEDGSRI